MRNKKADITSPFSGVCRTSGRWLAQYKPAKFYEKYPSEMEAFAHFITVYVNHQGPENKDLSQKMIRKNLPWIGRIPIEEMGHSLIDQTTGFVYYRIPIDRDPQHVVYLSGPDYENGRSAYWFVRDGVVMMISKCVVINGSYDFEYQRMDSLIYSRLKGVDNINRHVIKVDGNEFNFRHKNLKGWSQEDMDDVKFGQEMYDFFAFIDGTLPTPPPSLEDLDHNTPPLSQE